MSALSLPPGPGPGSDVGTKGSADLAAENARLRQQLDAVTKERARHKTDNERLARRLAVRFEQTEKARAEVEWMRPVVEAAEAWRALQTLPEPFADDEVLIAAVDAWRAAQPDPKAETVGDALDAIETLNRVAYGEAPATGPSATVGDELDLDDPEQRQALIAMQSFDAHERNEPADPAGLAAAIEAVMPMLLRWLDDEVSSGDTRNLAKAVIQDAAPHIRRAVLLEAADAWEYGSDGSEDRGAWWLRERAERETT